MIRTMLSLLAAQTKKFLESAQKPAIRKPSSRLCLEALETRDVPTTWEGLGNYTFRNDTPAVVVNDPRHFLRLA